MRYILYLIFLVISYILPFIIPDNIILLLDGDENKASMGHAVFWFLIYLLSYLSRFIFFIIVGLITFRFKERFVNIYKYNFLILLMLLFVDVVLYNTLDTLLQMDFFKCGGALQFFCFLSLSSTYFPFWLVFGVKNLVCYIKNFMTKKG